MIHPTVLAYLDKGARTFVPKSALPGRELVSRGISGQDEDEIRRAAMEVVERILQIAAEYQPIKRLVAARPPVNGTVRKSGPPSELSDQIAFFREVAALDGARGFFPPLLDAPREESLRNTPPFTRCLSTK